MGIPFRHHDLAVSSMGTLLMLASEEVSGINSATLGEEQ